jgi:GT2 family glycosyltransferase
MKLSIILVSYNTRDILKNALMKVYAQSQFQDFEVIVVDNDSHDGSADMVAETFPRVKLVRHDQNGGFAAGNNLGIAIAQGEYILLLNSDAYVFDDSLAETVSYMDRHQETGIMGAQLVCEDGSPQPSARPFPTPWQKLRVLSGFESRHASYETYYDYYTAKTDEDPEPRKVGWVPGTYFMIRRQVIDQIGVLDERFFMYYEEVDYCLRATRAGWNIVFNPTIPIIHLGGQSSLATQKEVSRTGRQLIDIRVNSEYDYYRKNAGTLVMLSAAGIELAWKSMVWMKNRLLRNPQAKIKREESQMALGLVWRKLVHELT